MRGKNWSEKMSSWYLLVVRPLYDTKRIFCIQTLANTMIYRQICHFFFNTNGAVTFSLPEIHPSYLSDFGDLLWSRQQKEHSANLRCRCAHAIRAVWCLWFRTNPLLRRLARRLDVFRLLPKVSWGWYVVILDGHWYHSLVLTLRYMYLFLTYPSNGFRRCIGLDLCL